MQVFEMKTGKFTLLSDAQLARFDEGPRRAYDELASAVAALDIANAEVECAIAANRAAVDTLRAAEIAEAARPKWNSSRRSPRIAAAMEN